MDKDGWPDGTRTRGADNGVTRNGEGQAPAAPAGDTKKTHRIFYSLLLLLLLAGVIPLGLFGFKMININREELKTKQRTSQLAIVGNLSEFIRGFLEVQSAELRSLAAGFAVAMDGMSGEEFMEKIRREGTLDSCLMANKSMLKIVLLNKDLEGWQVANPDYRTDTHVEQLLTTLALEKTSRKEGTGGYSTYRSEPIYLEGGSRCGIVFSAPIVSNGEYQGVVSSVVALDPIQRMVEEKSEELYEVYVLDDRKRLLAYSGPDGSGVLNAPPLADSEITDYYFRNRDAGAQTISFTAPGADHPHEMVGSYAYIPEMPCGVFLQISLDKAYYSVIRMRDATLKWSLGSLGIALILSFFFARWITIPISHLSVGALKLARGDFSHKIRIKSGNELGQLAGTFNFMSAEIQRHIEEIKEAARVNEELFISSIRMLAAAIDEKDPYTRGHSQRVTQYSVIIARNMGLDEQEIERIRIAALLHDVGKIGIDDAILKKPGNLTDEEYEIMKQHPEKGAIIMSPVKQLGEIIPVMRYHHERVNGTGYPAGLSGDEIPLAAQIISVADTFDAMTTNRPYQQAMTPDFVAEKIEGWRDIRFDRSVVAGFLAAFKKGEIQPYVPSPEEHPAGRVVT